MNPLPKEHHLLKGTAPARKRQPKLRLLKYDADEWCQYTPAEGSRQQLREKWLEDLRNPPSLEQLDERYRAWKAAQPVMAYDIEGYDYIWDVPGYYDGITEAEFWALPCQPKHAEGNHRKKRTAEWNRKNREYRAQQEAKRAEWDEYAERCEQAKQILAAKRRPGVCANIGCGQSLADGQNAFCSNDCYREHRKNLESLVSNPSAHIGKLNMAEINEHADQLRIRRAAAQLVDAEEAAASWHAPTEGGLLKVLLEQPRSTPEYVVDRLAGYRHNVGIAAQYKTGKTTLALSLAACLVDGRSFLDRDTALPLGMRVGWWNGEMDADDWNDAVRPLNIMSTDRLAVLHLRGHRMPIMNDNVAEWTVGWLRDNDVSMWILDSWRVLCAWNGLNENDNNDVGRLTARIDEIKREANADAFVTLVHTPRAQMDEGTERARGAAAFDDWVDARWVITQDQGTRFIAAEGRQRVELWTTALVFDPVTGALTLGEGSKREARAKRDAADAVAWVAAHPGQSTEAVSIGTGHRAKSSADTSRALFTAELDGLVYHTDVRNGKYWHPGVRPDDVACTCMRRMVKGEVGY